MSEPDFSHLPPPPPPPPPVGLGVPVDPNSRVAGDVDGVWPHRRLRIGFGQVLLGVLCVLVVAAIGATAWIISGMMTDPDFLDQNTGTESVNIPNGWLLVITTTSTGVFLAWPWIVSRMHGTRSLANDFGLYRPTRDDLSLAALLTVGSVGMSMFLTQVLAPALGFGTVESNAADLGIADMPVVTFVAFLFVSAVLTGFGEELFFRGLVFTAALNRFRSPRTAIGVQAVLFGILHFSGTGAVSAATIVFTLIIGTVYGIVAYRTGRISAVAIAHMLNNGIAVGILYATG